VGAHCSVNLLWLFSIRKNYWGERLNLDCICNHGRLSPKASDLYPPISESVKSFHNDLFSQNKKKTKFTFPLSRKRFYISPYFRYIYTFPPMFVQFTFFGFIYVFLPLFWPWMLYTYMHWTPLYLNHYGYVRRAGVRIVFICTWDPIKKDAKCSAQNYSSHSLALISEGARCVCFDNGGRRRLCPTQKRLIC